MIRLRCSVLIVSIAFLSGCASSPDDLRKEPEVSRLCSQLTPTVVASAISEGWQRCYLNERKRSSMVVAGGIPIVSGPKEDFVRVEVSGGRHTVIGGTVVPHGAMVVLIADVEATASCPAEVVTRGLGPIWRGRAKTVGHHLSGKEGGCP
jgi:hypothetical protein